MQWKLRATGKTKNMSNTTLKEEAASAGSQKATVHLEKHAHSNMTRTSEAKGTDDLVNFLRQAHRTEIRSVTEKVAMTEALKAHENLLVKVRQVKRTDHIV